MEGSTTSIYVIVNLPAMNATMRRSTTATTGTPEDFPAECAAAAAAAAAALLASATARSRSASVDATSTWSRAPFASSRY